MKRNYWSPQRTSTWFLSAIAVFALVGVGVVEHVQTDASRDHLAEKLNAAEIAQRSMMHIKSERVARGLSIDPATDISQSGLIGQAMSPITSNNGSLPAKQTSANPNFAAVVVDMLAEAGVKKGDTIAVGFSGSFPAMNVAVLSAAEAMELQSIIISSGTASQWGANVPEFPWLDMEYALVEEGLIRHRSVAASMGGIEDMGIGVPLEGMELLQETINKRQVAFIDPTDYLDSVNQRMELYRRHAQGKPIKAYINVGGGTVSVGTKKGKHLFEPGLNRHRPLAPLPADSVMSRFISEDIPVIHLVQIDDLATRYGLPLQPAEIPAVGDGDVFSPRTYNKWLAGGILFVIVVGLVGVSRTSPAIGKIPPHSVSNRRQVNTFDRSETEAMPL